MSIGRLTSTGAHIGRTCTTTGHAYYRCQGKRDQFYSAREERSDSCLIPVKQLTVEEFCSRVEKGVGLLSIKSRTVDDGPSAEPVGVGIIKTLPALSLWFVS